MEQENLMVTQPDEKIVFRQLKGKGKAGDFDITEETGEAGDNQEFMSEVERELD